MTSTTPESEFDAWFSDTHGGTGEPTWELEDDCDDVDFDSFDDPDE